MKTGGDGQGGALKWKSTEKETSRKDLEKDGWIRWKKISEENESARVKTISSERGEVDRENVIAAKTLKVY